MSKGLARKVALAGEERNSSWDFGLHPALLVSSRMLRLKRRLPLNAASEQKLPTAAHLREFQLQGSASGGDSLSSPKMQNAPLAQHIS